jgi:hypothetical protein
MKNAKVWCLLGLLSLGGAAVSQAQQTTGATEKAVLALEDQWAQSERTNNVDLVAPLLADKFVYTGTDGKVSDRAAFLAELRATKWTGVENEDVKATVFGDTVVVTGTFKAKGSASGKPIDEHTPTLTYG